MKSNWTMAKRKKEKRIVVFSFVEQCELSQMFIWENATIKERTTLSLSPSQEKGAVEINTKFI